MNIAKLDTLSRPYLSLSISSLVNYVTTLSVSFHDLPSLFGFMIFATIISQLISGTMLSFSLIPEGMYIPMAREEEDLEDLFIDDFYWLHERGVDYVFIFSYLHLFRKFYLQLFDYENKASWRSGVFVFLIFQVVVFLGLVLCCTHLSEITLTIAANIMHTFFGFYGKPYWWIFTDRQLNTDTLVRLAYAHYLSAFYLTFIAALHSFDMHYDWKTESTRDGIFSDLTWWNEVLLMELGATIEMLFLFTFICAFMYHEPESLSYELFMWGDIGIVNDVRFSGVAPHWYFRPFMAWLLVCPHHKTGIFGLLFLFIALMYQPNIHGYDDNEGMDDLTILLWWPVIKRNSLPTEPSKCITLNMYKQLLYTWFFMCALYTTSFLPYGKFYNRLGGNIAMLYSYMFVYIYLSCASLRNPNWEQLVNTRVDLWAIEAELRSGRYWKDVYLEYKLNKFNLLR